MVVKHLSLTRQSFSTTSNAAACLSRVSPLLCSTKRSRVNGFSISDAVRHLASTHVASFTDLSSKVHLLPIEDRKLLRKYYKVGLPRPSDGPIRTWSFYRFFEFPEHQKLAYLKEELLVLCLRYYVRGRIYISPEGVNAQLSCPDANLTVFKNALEDWCPNLRGTLWNEATNTEQSFPNMHVRVKKFLVNDGSEGTVCTSQVMAPQAKHLDPADWHRSLLNEIKKSEERTDDPPLVIDLRNHYESAIGTVTIAFRPDVATYREGVLSVRDALEKENRRASKRPVFMYCTGGIRCTRTGSVLAQEGQDNLVVLRGGVTAYARYIKDHPEIRSLYRGKNFTFDQRLGEPVTDDIIGRCHSCPPEGRAGSQGPAECDRYVSCSNARCDLFLIQCDACYVEHNGTCGSKTCLDDLRAAQQLTPDVGTRRSDGTFAVFRHGTGPDYQSHDSKVRPNDALREGPSKI